LVTTVPITLWRGRLYHVAVHELAQRLLTHIRREEFLRAGDRVGVAVSGGIDSVALLRLLIELRQELGIVISVVHFNHKLRGAESDADQEFVAGLAREHGLEFYLGCGDTAETAAQEHSGIEAAARELRYGFFRELFDDRLDAEDTSGAKAQSLQGLDHSAGSAAPPKGVPQGLKPEPFVQLNGTAEAVPFPNPDSGTAEAVPFSNPDSGTAGAAPLPNPDSGAVEAVPFPNPDSGAVEAVPFPNPDSDAAEAVPFSNPDPEAAGAAPLPNPPLDKIATGHTLDDQAETVLMRMIRGTGMRGLGGIHPRLLVEDEDGQARGEIVRPLLTIRRRELEQYLRDIEQPWREDSSNADSRFTRNRVRKLVVPLLEREFNPAVVESLSELATIARDEEDYWENEISGWLGTVVHWSEPAWTRDSQDISFVQIEGADGGPGPCLPMDFGLRARINNAPWLVMNASVSRPWLLTEPRAVQRRVVKAIGEQAGIPLEFKHIEEILRFAEDDGPAGKELSLPLGWKLLREPEALVFATPDLRRQKEIPDYEHRLDVPGRLLVPELGIVIEALRLTAETALSAQSAEYNPQQLLKAELLSKQLTVRNWRAGDRYWPAHTKAPKKVKELLQGRHLTPTERRLWPVVVSGDEIVWMRGFPVPARIQAKKGEEAVLIREGPWGHPHESF